MRSHWFVMLPVYLLTLTVSCSSLHTLSAAEEAEIARLSAVRDTIQVQLVGLGEEQREPENMLQVMEHLRRLTLHNTDNLIQQRVEAIRAGARFDYTVPSVQRSEESLTAIKAEIEAAEARLRTAESRAGEFPEESLMSVMARMEENTHLFTLAMLNLARLSLEYGLGLPEDHARALAGRMRP